MGVHSSGKDLVKHNLEVLCEPWQAQSLEAEGKKEPEFRRKRESCKLPPDLIRRLFVTCVVAFLRLFRGPHLLRKTVFGRFRGFFVVFSWLFRGPHFGAILRVLALEESSDLRCLESRIAVRGDSNRHRFAAISNHTIRIARPKTVQIAVQALLF